MSTGARALTAALCLLCSALKMPRFAAKASVETVEKIKQADQRVELAVVVTMGGDNGVATEESYINRTVLAAHAARGATVYDVRAEQTRVAHISNFNYIALTVDPCEMQHIFRVVKGHPQDDHLHENDQVVAIFLNGTYQKKRLNRPEEAQPYSMRVMRLTDLQRLEGARYADRAPSFSGVDDGYVPQGPWTNIVIYDTNGLMLEFPEAVTLYSEAVVFLANEHQCIYDVSEFYEEGQASSPKWKLHLVSATALTATTKAAGKNRIVFCGVRIRVELVWNGDGQGDVNDVVLPGMLEAPRAVTRRATSATGD